MTLSTADILNRLAMIRDEIAVHEQVREAQHAEQVKLLAEQVAGLKQELEAALERLAELTPPPADPVIRWSDGTTIAPPAPPAIGREVTLQPGPLPSLETGTRYLLAPGEYRLATHCLLPSDCELMGQPGVVLLVRPEAYIVTAGTQRAVLRNLTIRGEREVKAITAGGTDIQLLGITWESVAFGVYADAEGNAKATRWLIRGCRCEANQASAYAIWLTASRDVWIDQCVFDRTRLHCVRGPRNVRLAITRCHFTNHGRVTCFTFNGGPEYAWIAGNTFNGLADQTGGDCVINTSEQMTPGLPTDRPSAYIVIRGNTFNNARLKILGPILHVTVEANTFNLPPGQVPIQGIANAVFPHAGPNNTLNEQPIAQGVAA